MNAPRIESIHCSMHALCVLWVLGWYERTKADSAFVRSDQSATLASKSAGDAIKGPWGEGVVNAYGGEEIWEWAVCKRTVVRFFFSLLRDRCKLKKRKARVQPSPTGLIMHRPSPQLLANSNTCTRVQICTSKCKIARVKICKSEYLHR